MAVSFEIRDGRLHISGYVNAVERDSLPIMTARGKCVEQIRAGAFAQSMADGHEIRLRYNHKRDIGSTSDGALTLREDNIGLYAEAVTDDEEVVTLAGKGELRGWSFGFVAKDDEVEERQNNIPRRHINALELREVSILSVQPAYNGTSLEYRDADGVELRAYDVYEDESAKVEVHRVNGEIKAIVETEREHSEQPSDDGNTVTDTMKRTEVTEGGIRTETVTEEHTWQRDNAALNAQIERMKMQGILMKLRAERKELEDRAFRSELAYRKAKMDESKAELEERYNHYHDPRTGQFASGKGGGMGLYYSMGKGRGEVVGASSPVKIANKPLDSTKIAQANARGSMFYSAGDALNRSYNRDIDDIEKMDGLTSEEKAEAKAKVHALASKELDARANYIDTYTAGPARGTGTEKHIRNAAELSSEREGYMKELKRKSDKVKTAREEKQVTDAIMAATERGETSVTINGKKYVRKSKRSGTWQQAFL